MKLQNREMPEEPRLFRHASAVSALELPSSLLRGTLPGGFRKVRGRARGGDCRWKRVLDLSLIIVAAPLVLPLGTLIALVIKTVSRGPVLFKQERIGYRGRPFTCWKFRTMFVNADTSAHAGHLDRLLASNGPMRKLDDAGDPRVIPGGKWLRSSGLDELPQLINVIRGEMSLVGPRPCIAYECSRYKPWYWRRFETLPGLTGFWQVNGKNETSFEQMIKLDLYYVRKKSIVLDLLIIARTAPVLLQQVYKICRKRMVLRKSPAINAVNPRA